MPVIHPEPGLALLVLGTASQWLYWCLALHHSGITGAWHCFLVALLVIGTASQWHYWCLALLLNGTTGVWHCFPVALLLLLLPLPCRTLVRK